MHTLARCVAAIAAILVSSPIALAQAAPETVAVMDTSVSQGDEATATVVSTTLADYLANTLKQQVTSRDDVRKRLSFEQQKQLLGCESAACATAGNVGEMLGVARLVTSSLTRAGSRLVVGVVVLDARTGMAVGREAGEVAGPAELVEKVRDLLHFSWTGQRRESMGYVRVVVPVAGAAVMVDGQLVGQSPLLAPWRGLQGRHVVHVEKNGFLPYEVTITVEAGKESTVEAALIAQKDVKVAGLSILPYASATAGIAVALAAASGYFYYDAANIYQNKYLNDPNKTGVYGKVSLADLNAAKADVEFRGNTLAYYGSWSAAVLGGLSAALFGWYAMAGVDADKGPAPTVALEPRADGIAVRF